LDMYLPSIEHSKTPVVIFVSGGAWTIGYKAWGALIGKVLSAHGVLFVAPDYRNFPQGKMEDMLLDIKQSVQWVFDHIEKYGGDPTQVFLIGQSAGAQLGAMIMVQQAIYEANNDPSMGWKCSALKGFVGISGPYDLFHFADHYDRRGLRRKVLETIAHGDLKKYSPTLCVAQKQFKTKKVAKCVPPITLFHGTADKTQPHKSTLDFADALKKCKNIKVKAKYWEGKTHTDPIIEDPFAADYTLMEDIITTALEIKPNFGEFKSICAHILIRMARVINPF